MTHGQKAEMLFKKGYNCAQSVLCAYCDELGLDETTAQMIASGFGGGMGRMREICGAVSGMFMVAGLKNGYTDKSEATAKKDTYSQIQNLAAAFKKECGSIVCRELLGLNAGENSGPTPTERTDEFYRKRPCGELCRLACDILDGIN
ncbi:MAG: C_GCAxxG_C_C family protein [Clostridia bacterium]|nr:C_GCAxxG_C_C family protein [Clostridia bacterium]